MNISKKALAIGAFGCMLGAQAEVVNIHDTPTTWFNETYGNYVLNRSTKWTTSAGAWRKADDGDLSVCSNTVQKTYLNTCGRELKFTPALASKTNALSCVNVDVSFTAYRGGEEWEVSDGSQKAGFTLAMKDDSSLVFEGWQSTRDGSNVKGRWVALSNPNVTPEENKFFTVTIESDFSSVPTRVRYSVDGNIMANDKGETWFSTRGGSLDPASQASLKKIPSTIGFMGNGVIGTMSATQAILRTPRAEVAFKPEAILRPQIGTEIGFELVTNETTLVKGNLNYTWYLTDATGQAGERKSTTGDKYALTADDYGHWVSVDVADETGYLGTGKFWFSNLPVIYLTVTDSADGYVKTDDEVAQAGQTYYWADEDDLFSPITNATGGAVETGTDLTPYYAQYGDLFVLAKVAWPTSKKEEHTGTMTIVGNDEYDTSDYATHTIEKIHVRGNSTAGCDKKPYKLKLKKKSDLFGLGGGTKNKHWVLLANCFDESLMRNKLCYDLSAEFGVPVSMKSEWVDVVMNGQFVGNYQLCQHIRIAEERINIHEWDGGTIAENALIANPALGDDDQTAIETLLETNCSWIVNSSFVYLGTNYTITADKNYSKKGKGKEQLENTVDENGNVTIFWKDLPKDGARDGGYVYELDWKKWGPQASGSKAISGCYLPLTVTLCLAMNAPEYAFNESTLSNEMRTVWTNIAKSWTSGSNYDANGNNYQDLCDFDSMIGYYLSIFVPGNNDAGGLSRYAYKDIGGKMTFGPAWDFDYGLGSLQIRAVNPSASDKTKGYVINDDGSISYPPIQPTGWIPSVGGANFMGYWTADPYFIWRLREKYYAVHEYLADIVADGGRIDRYMTKLASSARANDLRWNNRIGFFGTTVEPGDAYVLKDFLTQRFAWFDKQIGYSEGNLGTAIANMTTSVANSGLRYSRNANLLISFAESTARADSKETNLTDVNVKRHATRPVKVSITAPSNVTATKARVYVNGRLIGDPVNLTNKQAVVEIAPATFNADAENFIAVDTLDANSKVTSRNVAVIDYRVTTSNFILK